jgi:uncharacterized glyoxalase superfamily protein PhnB
MAVQPIPEGYRTITPYLCVDNGSAAIDFYKQAFGATETVRMAGPGDSIMHAEIEIGDSKIGLSDPFPPGPDEAAEGARRHECQHPRLRRGHGRAVQAGDRCRRDVARRADRHVLG